jgi:hypothetical protein
MPLLAITGRYWPSPFTENTKCILQVLYAFNCHGRLCQQLFVWRSYPVNKPFPGEIPFNSVNQLIFLMDTCYVFFETGTEFLNIISMILSIYLLIM